MEHCANIPASDGLWFDDPCNETKNYICEDKNDSLDFWNPCQDGWDLINGKCFRLIDQTLKAKGAIDICKALGGDLFEPTNEQIETAVLDFYDNPVSWIGINDEVAEGR